MVMMPFLGLREPGVFVLADEALYVVSTALAGAGYQPVTELDLPIVGRLILRQPTSLVAENQTHRGSR
jgi:hypothetical protein